MRVSFRNKSICVLALAGVLTGMTSCNSGSSAKEEARENAPAAASKSAPAGDGVIGADYCLQTFMKTPVAAPIHFVYKAKSSDGEAITWEGDIAANTADISMLKSQPSNPDLAKNSAYKIHDGVADFSNTLHYTRSEDHDWQMAPTMPVQTSTPWGVFLSKPPIDKVGPETVNGFEAVKFTVDNSKQDLIDRIGFTGVKDYIVNGTVWLTKDTGCMLQWTMDAQTTHKDGTISKQHYEGTVTKK